MNNYSRLHNYIDSNDWESAIDYLLLEVEKDSDDVNASINLIYCLGIFLTEMDISATTREKYTKISIEYFRRANEHFVNNPIFLFYAGFMICIGEWNFGVEDYYGNTMIDRAYNLCPTCFLYRWSLYQNGPHQAAEGYLRELREYCLSFGYSFILEHGPIGDYIIDCFHL